MFPPGFKELLSVFNSRRVRYLVIGGDAVIVHSQPRATKDLDDLVSPDSENAKALYEALAGFGAPLDGLTPVDFSSPGYFFRMGSPPLMVDLLLGVKGVDFDAAWERRTRIEMDAASGATAWVISSEDLIESKLASGRPQDIADVAAIRETNRQLAVERKEQRGNNSR